MAVFQYKREWYSKSFGEVLLSRHRYLIVMGGRGCFMGGQKVQTDKGLKPIIDIEVGESVLSYNESTQSNEYKKVIDTFKYDCDEELVVVETDKGVIKCTKDHRFFINGKWIKIIDLIHENSNSSKLPSIYNKRGRNNLYTFEIRRQQRRYFKASYGRERLSKNDVEAQGWADKNNKSSQDSSGSLFRSIRFNSKPQRRQKTKQSHRQFGVFDPQRKLPTCQRKRLAKFAERQSNRQFHIKGASSFRNKSKVYTTCLREKETCRRVWGTTMHDKRRYNSEELGAFTIKSVEFKKHKGHVYDICVADNHNYILDGGIIAHNSGKTNHIMLKLFAETFSNNHVSVVYCRHEYETIRKTTFKDMCNFLKSKPELEECFNYSTSTNGSMTFTNKLTGNQITPFGLDDADKTKGISEATIVWIDEMDKCTKDQYAMINSVLRTPQAEYLQFIGSFNPVSETSWIRSTFFDERDAYAPNSDYGDELLIHRSTVHDNEYIDVDAYVKSLTLMYAGNKTLLDVNLRGLWGLEQNNNPWMHAFDYEKHVKKSVPFLPTFPIYVFIDVNNDPLECTIWQISPQKGTKNSFIHCIDEFSGKYKINQLGAAIKAKYPYSIIYIGGDRSGQNEDVGRNQTVYQILAGTMGLNEKQMLLNTQNLTHADSYMLCNAMFFNYPNIFISEENCPNLIEQLQKAEIDNKSATPFKLRKDREQFKLDSFDSMRYMFQTLFNDFAKNTYFRARKG